MNTKRPNADRPHDTGPKGKLRLLTLEDLDRRTKAAQVALDMRDRLIAERGGPDALSALRLAMVESVAVLSAMVSDMQIRWLRGEPIEAAALATLVNTRRREAELVGLDAEPRDVTPNLATYLASRGGRDA